MVNKIQIDSGTAGDRTPKNTSDTGSTFCRAKIVSPTTVTSKNKARILIILGMGNWELVIGNWELGMGNWE
jgi:hypothetical protein